MIYLKTKCIFISVDLLCLKAASHLTFEFLCVMLGLYAQNEFVYLKHHLVK